MRFQGPLRPDPTENPPKRSEPAPTGPVRQKLVNREGRVSSQFAGRALVYLPPWKQNLENRALAATLDVRAIRTVGSATGEGSVAIARPKERSDSVSR